MIGEMKIDQQSGYKHVRKWCGGRRPLPGFEVP
jgi:hypothetical protein